MQKSMNISGRQPSIECKIASKLFYLSALIPVWTHSNNPYYEKGIDSAKHNSIVTIEDHCSRTQFIMVILHY